MMAYMRALYCPTCKTCVKVNPATVEVLDNRNLSQGCYCTPCGKRKLAELERDEKPQSIRGMVKTR